MTETDGFPPAEPDETQADVAEPDESQEAAPEAAPADEPEAAPEPAEEPVEPPEDEAAPFVPDGQPYWLTEIIQSFHRRLKNLGG